MASQKPAFGGLGPNLSSALKSDFFKFFNLHRVESVDHNGGSAITYKPSAPQFREKVTVVLTIDKRKTIVGAQLALNRTFVQDPANGRFAMDIAASFLRACLSEGEDYRELTEAAAAIRRPSKENLARSAALRVYWGMQELCSLPIPAGLLQMRNRSESNGQWLVFTAGGEANKETTDRDAKRARIGDAIRRLKSAEREERIKISKETLALLDSDQDGELRAALNLQIAEDLMDSKTGAEGQNLDEFIDACRAALLYNSPEEDLTIFITTTIRLADAYRERAKLKKSGDLDNAIACEEQVIRVMPRDKAPVDWAQLNSRLADDYENRTEGSIPENRKKAMRYAAAALEARPPESSGFEGLGSARKLLRLANEIADDEARGFQDEAMRWLRTLADTLRPYANPVERAAAQEELRAALGAIPADPRPDLQKATQRMWPFLFLAETLVELGRQYIRAPGEENAANQDLAIAALEEALEQIPADAMADIWSGWARSLGYLYQTRRSGQRSQNFERIFALYQEALNGPLRQIDEEKWVELLFFFTDAYAARKESHADRLDRLIAWLEIALTLPSVAEDVRQRALVRLAMGHAHMEYPTGNRSDHIEQAIELCQVALTDSEGLDDSPLCASIFNNLGIAYAKRIQGDQVENIEEAIGNFEEAARCANFETSPALWAGAMMDLGIEFSLRQRGDRAENLNRSLECYQQALKGITKESDAFAWASLMHNIGTLYLRGRDLDEGANIESARQAFEDVLTVRTAENVPDFWALTMSNLGNLYLNRLEGDAAANYERGIEYCRGALTVQTRTANPHGWAETLNHLGNLHHRLYGIKRQEQSENWPEHFDQAKQAYADALEVMTPDADPGGSVPLAESLAYLYAGEKRWEQSLGPYRQAIRSAENLYQTSLLKSTRELQLEEVGDLYRRAAYAMAQAGETQEAVLTLERGRARGLNESLALDRANLTRVQAQDPEAYTAFHEAAARLRQLEEMDRQAASTHDAGPGREQLRTAAQHARADIAGALRRIRGIVGFENFLLPVSWGEICEQVQPGAPIVYVAAAPEGTLTAFLARKSMTEKVVLETWANPAFGQIDLYSMISNDSGERPGWVTAYMDRHGSASTWQSALARVCDEIWQPIMKPLMEKILSWGAEELVLIPCGLFAFLPLHAARSGDGAEGVYALDMAAFRYAPSASVLASSRRTAAEFPPDVLLAVAEPSPVDQAAPLPNAVGEVARIATLFEDKTVLAHSQATLETVLAKLPAAHVAHFACHGGSNWHAPLQSSLLMANDASLRVVDLLRLTLDGARLAVLSACETAIVGTRLPVEQVSLPSALLQAGFAGVVASMWSVFDLSTALLMPQFYQFWIQDGVPAHQALRKAVKRLKQQTAAEFAKSLEATRAYAATVGEEDYEQASEAWEHFAFDYAPEDRPYAHPVFWAAFTYTGV